MLSGITAFQARPYASYAPQASLARSIVALPAAQPETPVMAVTPVRSVKAVQSGPLNQNAMLSRWENDPAAMSVRGRIQYGASAQETAAQEGESAMAGGVEEAAEQEGNSRILPDAREEAAAQELSGDGGDDRVQGEKKEIPSAQEVAEEAECQTCKERKYQDGSDDPGVSFKTAAHIAPNQAASVVRGHEQEHVVREQAKAKREDREVVSQSVTLHTGICPECGRTYVSGGTTRTVTRANQEPVPQETEESGETGDAKGKDAA